MSTTTPATAAAETSRALSESTVCLSLRIGMIGSRRKMASTRVALVEGNGSDEQAQSTKEISENQPESASLHVHKDILKCTELENVRTQANEIRKFVASRALPSIMRGGIYLLAVASVPEIERRLEEMKVTRRGLVAAFCEAYDAAKEEARTRLGDAFDESDYPNVEDVRAAFTMDSRWLTFATPTSLRQISQQLFEREQKKAERAWSVASDEIVTLLRAQFKQLVDHAAERLKPTAEGERPRVFRNTLVSNIQDFIDSFNPRNVCNDAELAALVERARGLVSGVEADTLRSNDSLRGQMAERFTEMAATLDTMVTARPRRLITFEE